MSVKNVCVRDHSLLASLVFGLRTGKGQKNHYGQPENPKDTKKLRTKNKTLRTTKKNRNCKLQNNVKKGSA